MNIKDIKGYDLINKSSATPEQQLKIVKEVLNNLLEEAEYSSLLKGGLCYRFRYIIRFLLLGRDIDYNEISLYIPLFNKANADKFTTTILTNDEDDFWWNTGYDYDIDNRILFLNWMIETINYYITNNI